VPVPKHNRDASAFLNIPYDARYSRLYLAFIAGLSAYGLAPRATVEIPGGQGRLDRILELIQECRYSFHDLSRVEVNLARPRTPRFNMPFELGLAVASQKLVWKDQMWFVFESRRRRLSKSLSDLNGTDPYIHGGTARGVFRELTNALVRIQHQPSVEEMSEIYRELRKVAPRILREAGADSLFGARVFRNLAVVGARLRRLQLEQR
jgi:hypothetical protein